MDNKVFTDCNHNERSRYTNGFQCDDKCKRFIQQGSLEYFIEEEISDIWCALHNRECDASIPKELEELKDELEYWDYYNKIELKQDPKSAIKLKNKCNKLLKKYKIDKDEAIRILQYP